MQALTAQLVERKAVEQRVPGLNPSLVIFFLFGISIFLQVYFKDLIFSKGVVVGVGLYRGGGINIVFFCF
jgi:hypothetical protein